MERMVIRKSRWPAILFWSVFASVLFAGVWRVKPLLQEWDAEIWSGIEIGIWSIYLVILFLKLGKRSRWEVDHKTICRFGWFGNVKQTYQTDEFEYVGIEKVFYKRSSTNPVKYYLVTFNNQNHSITPKFHKNYFHIRNTAERAAKASRLDLVDATDTPHQRREAKTLDMSLAERLQRAGKAPTSCQNPTDRIQTETAGVKTALLPTSGLDFFAIPKIIGLLVIAFFVHLMVQSGVLAILAGGVAIGILLLHKQRISVENNCLQSRTEAFIPLFFRSIPLQDLEELYVANHRNFLPSFKKLNSAVLAMQTPGTTLDTTIFESYSHHLVARSDKKKIVIGRGLSLDEAEFLLHTLENWVRTETRMARKNAYNKLAI